MRYSGYGVGELSGPTGSRQDARVTSKGPRTRMEDDRPDKPDEKFDRPRGVTEKEAAFLLGIFARLKETRFGRVEVTVREGSVTSVEFVEKVDRNLIQFVSS